jgi:hypothetical protein
MARRHSDALAIQAGAVNPSAIALMISEACREIGRQPGYSGTAQLTSDPAVRLMVHQLAFICKANDDQLAGSVYAGLVTTCERELDSDLQPGRDLVNAVKKWSGT